MAADKNSAELEKGLDDPGMSGDGQFKKNIISKKKAVDVHIVYDTPQVKGVERRRLVNEAHLLWDVYFTRKKTTDERAVRDRENAIKAADKKNITERLQDKKEADERAKKADKKGAKKADKKGANKIEIKDVKKVEIKDSEKGRGKKVDKKGVTGKVTDKVKKSGLDINKNKVEAEASLFWHVYYKIKDRKEKKKDTAGKTKLTPVKAAIEKVRGEKEPKPKKEGKGFIGWLMGLFAPFASLLAPLLAGAGGGFLALLGAGLTTLIGAIAPLIIAGAGIFALVAAVAFAVNAIGKAWKGWKDMRQAQKDAKKAEEDTQIESKSLSDSMSKQSKKALDSGDKDAARMQELMARQVEGSQASMDATAKVKGGWIDQMNESASETAEIEKIRETWMVESEANSAEMKEIRERRAKQNAALEAAGKTILPDMGSYGNNDSFWLAGHRNKGVGIYSEDKAKRAHAEKMREEKGLPKIKVDYYGPRDASKEKAAPKKKPKSRMYRGIRRDFISRPGMEAISFDSKDDILGFKQGGPVSNLLKQVTTSSITSPDKFGKFQLDAIHISNTYLKQLVELTAKMLQKGPSGGGKSPGIVPASPLPPDNSIQGDMSGPGYTDSRSDFYGSAYSMHTPSVPA